MPTWARGPGAGCTEKVERAGVHLGVSAADSPAGLPEKMSPGGVLTCFCILPVLRFTISKVAAEAKYRGKSMLNENKRKVITNPKIMAVHTVFLGLT